MPKARSVPARIDESHRSLQCVVCGAGNRLGSEAREHGWLRCGHCGTRIPVPGVGDYVVEGPGGEVWRVVRPGSSEIGTGPGFVFDFVSALLAVAAADLLGSGVIEGARAVGDPALADALTPWLLPMVLCVAGLGALGFLTRQRLTVRAGRLTLAWVTAGREWRRRRLDTRRFRAAARSKRPFGVDLEAPGRRLSVTVDDARAAEWLEREIRAAVEDARTPPEGPLLPCPGCGGPVASPRELRDAGGIDCAHCGTGLIATAGAIALPPVRLLDRLGPDPDVERPEPERSGDTLEWRLASWASGHRASLPFQTLLMVGLVGGLGALTWWPARSLPQLRTFAVSAAVAVTIALAYLVWLWLGWTFGRQRLRLDATVLEHEVRVGPWSSRTTRIPLGRVLVVDAYDWVAEELRVEAPKEPRDRARLHVRTAVGEHGFDLLGAWKVLAVRDLMAALPERLEALGRGGDPGGDAGGTPRA